MTPIVQRLCELVEDLRLNKVVSTVAISEAEDAIADHLCKVWEDNHVMPDNQRMVRHVRTSLAALGATPRVIRNHSIRIAWKIRNICDNVA